WTAWSQTGQQRRVTVTGVDRDGACVQAITLATSSKPDAPADGLAFTRPTKVDAIVELEQSSRQWEVLRRELVPYFRTALTNTALPQPGREQGDIGAKVVALGRADKSAAEALAVSAVFRDPRLPVFF